MVHSPSRRHPGPAPNIARRLHRRLQQGCANSGHRQSTQIQAFNARPKGTATGYLIPAHCRVGNDVIDAAGVIAIRYNSHLRHIGLGKRRRGTKVIVLIDDREIRVLDRGTGQLLRKLVLDPPATTNHAASNAETHPKTGCRCKPCLGTPCRDKLHIPPGDASRA